MNLPARTSILAPATPLDPATPLFFDGEEISVSEPVIYDRFFPSSLDLREAFALACEKKTRDLVDRGFRAFAARHGWSEESHFRALVQGSARAGMARRALREEEEREEETLP